MYGKDESKWNADNADRAGLRGSRSSEASPVGSIMLHIDGRILHILKNGVVSRQGGGPDMAWNGPIGHVAVPLIIGAHSGDTYTGMIDEVAIYNRALSEQEVLKAMEKGHGVIAVRPLGKLTTCWAHTKLADLH
jgi:hypothetical protein